MQHHTVHHFRAQGESLVDDIVATLSERIDPKYIEGHRDLIRSSVQNILALYERGGRPDIDPDTLWEDICTLAKIRLRVKKAGSADAGWETLDPRMVHTADGSSSPVSKRLRTRTPMSQFDRDEHAPSTDRARYIRDHLDDF